jgi:hypothetical protein
MTLPGGQMYGQVDEGKGGKQITQKNVYLTNLDNKHRRITFIGVARANGWARGKYGDLITLRDRDCLLRSY